MTFNTKHLRTLLLSAALGAGCTVTLFTPVAMAQTSLGTLTGVVRDASGAVVTNATVTVTNSATSDTRKAMTSDQGAYRFDALPSGLYSLSVSAPGFQKQDATGVRVQASVSQAYDPTLTVGRVDETISVMADSEVLLNKENGSLSASLPTEELQKLPIFSLNPIEVLTTVPGVQIVSNTDFSNGQSIQVSGARPRSNNFMIDGEEINDAGIGGQALQPQIPDMYADTVIYTHNAPAEYGRASGGVINLITKSGTNSFHGSAWELYSGSGLNAVDGQTRLLPKNHGNKARYDQHQYGFTAGGPAWRNKLFGFGAAQFSRFYGQEQAGQVYLPNADGVALLKSIAAGSGTTAQQATLLLQYLGNGSYLNTFNTFWADPNDHSLPNKTAKLGAACPTPNCTMGIDLYRRPNVAQSQPNTQWSYRVDFTPHTADTFTARYLHDRGSLTPDFFTNPSSLPGFDSMQGGPSELGQGTWTHIFTSNLLNEFRVGEARLGFAFQPTAEASKNPFFTAPNLTTGDIVTLGWNQNFPQGRSQDMYQLQDTVSWTHGRHTVRVGFDLGRRLEKDLVSQNANGNINFTKGGTGSSAMGNFLLNQLGPAGTVTRTYGNRRLDPHSWRSGAYAQDDFKANSDLTINLGVRYDYFTAPENVLKYPAIDNANPYAAIDTVNKVTPDKNNWAPRVGFAFTPHQGAFASRKTVIRGGLGVFFDTDFTNIAINSAQSAPNAIAGTLTASKSVAPNGLPGAIGLVGQVPKVLNPKSSVTSVTKDLVSPYAIEYNLGIERELPGSIGVSATYVGTRGVKLFANQQYNSFDPNTGLRFNPKRGSIAARGNFADSNYNGLEVGLRRNFSHGIAVYASYEFSKSLDDGSEVFAPDSAGSSYPADLVPGGRRYDYGPSVFDHRHYAAFTYIWTPGGLHSSNSAGNALLGALTRHWTVSGTTRLQSGAYSTVNMLGLDMNGDGNAGNDRPILGNPRAPMSSVGIDGAFVGGIPGTYYDLADNNQTGATNIADPNFYHWLIPNAAGYIPQEIGRNSFKNPGQLWNDAALEKAIPTSLLHLERGQFVLRAEAKNFSNHNNVGLLDVNLLDVGTDSFMNTQNARDSTQASSNRALRFWAKFVF